MNFSASLIIPSVISPVPRSVNSWLCVWKTFQAVFLPWPASCDTLSQPVIAWNDSRVSTWRGGSSWWSMWIGMYFGFWRVPAFIHSWVHGILSKWAANKTSTSVSRTKTTTVSALVLTQWSTRRVSASSWLAARGDVSISGSEDLTSVICANPPATTRWGEVIPHGKEEKDLGVVITEDGKYSRQCAAAANKGMCKLRVLKHTFKHFDKRCFTMLYKTYIRPHLEYAVQAWSPHLKKDIALLEKVQRRATKLIPCIRHLSYADRLKVTKLYSLEQRRLRGDLIETFKILNDLEGINKGKLFNTNPHHDKNRGHCFKLYKEALKKDLNCRSKFFSVRVVSTWNNLPARVVEVKTINQFKNQLDNYWNENRYGVIKA